MLVDLIELAQSIVRSPGEADVTLCKAASHGLQAQTLLPMAALADQLHAFAVPLQLRIGETLNGGDRCAAIAMNADDPAALSLVVAMGAGLDLGARVDFDAFAKAVLP